MTRLKLRTRHLSYLSQTIRNTISNFYSWIIFVVCYREEIKAITEYTNRKLDKQEIYLKRFDKDLPNLASMKLQNSNQKPLSEVLKLELLIAEKEKITGRHAIIKDKCENFINSLKGSLEKVNS